MNNLKNPGSKETLFQYNQMCILVFPEEISKRKCLLQNFVIDFHFSQKGPYFVLVKRHSLPFFSGFPLSKQSVAEWYM